MSENRIGQWFVDATDPTKWYGPVTKCVDGTHYCERGWNGQAWILADSGDYLRIPPKLDLPQGKRSVECRLPKKGEQFWNLCLNAVCTARFDWAERHDNDDFGWRRWIVEDEPAAEPIPVPPAHQAAFDKLRAREVAVEIERLTRELDETRAACANAITSLEVSQNPLVGTKGYITVQACIDTALGHLRKPCNDCGQVFTQDENGYSPDYHMHGDETCLCNQLAARDKQIADLTTERDAARVACAEFVRKFQFLEEYWNGNHNEMAMADALERMLQVCEEAVQPSPGQPLLDELTRLRRLEAAVGMKNS